MKYYLDQKINDLASRVVELMPPLEAFFESNETIAENSEKLYAYKPLAIYKTRQQAFKQLIQNKVKKLFSASELAKIKIFQDENEGLKGGVVDHHGILNHPVLAGVNITPHFFRMFDREKKRRYFDFCYWQCAPE